MKTLEVLPKYAGFNKLINGNFDFWQRNLGFTGFSVANDNNYVADRFVFHNQSTGVYDITRSTDVPNDQSRFSCRMDITTADASPTYMLLEHRLEGSHAKLIYGKSIAISFYVKSNLTGTYTLALRNGSLFSRSYIVEYTVDVADTWERKVVVIPHEIVGTWNKSNINCMNLTWALSATLVGNLNTPDTWHNGNYYSTTNQVNLMASTSNYFMISQCMMHEGRYAIDDFIPCGGGNLGSELELCRRYYEKSYDQGNNPGSAVYNSVIFYSFTGISSAAHTYSYPVRFKVQKRAVPSMTIYSPLSGTAGQVSTFGGDRPGSIANIGTNGCRVQTNDAAPQTNLNFAMHFTADAEI